MLKNVVLWQAYYLRASPFKDDSPTLYRLSVTELQFQISQLIAVVQTISKNDSTLVNSLYASILRPTFTPPTLHFIPPTHASILRPSLHFSDPTL